MSLALYRKYRPQKWSDLTGQNHIKITLQNEIESGNLAHAFLFTGPRGIGKTTAARLLAKSVNCLNRKEGESEPCGKCDSCLELVEGNDLDILEIDAASHTGVDNVRENIIANARFTPVKRKYKVFIIDEVHMLSISAFNALLKILEEPPAHALFILATTEIHKVPATIISRCQRFDFKKINSDDLLNRLIWICQQEGVKVDKKVLLDISRNSEGCLRDAESLLGQVLSLGGKEISYESASLIIPISNYNFILELVGNLANKNIESSINLINGLAAEGVDFSHFTDDLIEFLRKIILGKISSGLKDFSFNLDETMEKAILELTSKFETSQLIELINLFSLKKTEIKSAVLPHLPLELAVIEYCSKDFYAGKNDKGGPGVSDNNSGGPDGNQTDNSQENKKAPPIESVSDNNNSQKNFKSGALNATLKNVNLQSARLENSAVKVLLSDIRDKWHKFIVKLQDYNASLVFILKVAEPLELNNDILKIGFKYCFHEQRINQAKVRESLESVLSEFFGARLKVKTCLLDKSYTSDFIDKQTNKDEVELVDEIDSSEFGQEQAELIDNLVKTFDGKVIE